MAYPFSCANRFTVPRSGLNARLRHHPVQSCYWDVADEVAEPVLAVSPLVPLCLFPCFDLPEFIELVLLPEPDPLDPLPDCPA